MKYGQPVVQASSDQRLERLMVVQGLTLMVVQQRQLRVFGVFRVLEAQLLVLQQRAVVVQRSY
jgi:hypothetical protein